MVFQWVLVFLWLQLFGWMQNKLNVRQGNRKTNASSSTRKFSFFFPTQLIKMWQFMFLLRISHFVLLIEFLPLSIRIYFASLDASVDSAMIILDYTLICQLGSKICQNQGYSWWGGFDLNWLSCLKLYAIKTWFICGQIVYLNLIKVNVNVNDC